MKVIKQGEHWELQTDQGNLVGVYSTPQAAQDAKSAADYTIAKRSSGPEPKVEIQSPKETLAQDLRQEAVSRLPSTAPVQKEKDWTRVAQAYDKVYHEQPTVSNALAAAQAYEFAGQKKSAFQMYSTALRHHGKDMSDETHKVINDKVWNMAQYADAEPQAATKPLQKDEPTPDESGVGFQRLPKQTP